jgi:uncharacterized protein (TIGR00369 family)
MDAINGSKLSEAWGANFHLLDNGTVAADFTITDAQAGPPGYAHGGALAALIDEAMGAANWFAGNRGMSVHLSFDYKRPVPVGASIHVSGQVEHREGRKVFTSGTVVLEDGSIAVKGSGIFVDAPQLLDNKTGFSLDKRSL